VVVTATGTGLKRGGTAPAGRGREKAPKEEGTNINPTLRACPSTFLTRRTARRRGGGVFPSEGSGEEEEEERRGVACRGRGARREGRRAWGEERRTGATGEEGKERRAPVPWAGMTKALVVVGTRTRRTKGVRTKARRVLLLLLLLLLGRGLLDCVGRLREEEADNDDDDASLLGNHRRPVAGCAMACLSEGNGVRGSKGREGSSVLRGTKTRQAR